MDMVCMGKSLLKCKHKCDQLPHALASQANQVDPSAKTHLNGKTPNDLYLLCFLNFLQGPFTYAQISP